MGDFTACVVGLVIGFVIGTLVGLGAGTDSQNGVWKKVTVERGLAIHCPKDGEWAWNGECK